MKHNDYELDLTRRRYGKKTTFTWISVKFGDKWHSAGDPLQKIMPSKKDLDEAVKRAQIYYMAEQQLKIAETAENLTVRK
jgi:hypothetical protein